MKSTQQRILFLIILFSVFAVGKTAWDRFSVPCYRCNVVVVAIDDLRADALPCFGYRLDTASNLCQYAAKNIVFSAAYANAPSTKPSEMSLFTSLYPPSHGLVSSASGKLNPRIVTLPQAFQNAGYETTFVGEDTPALAPEAGFGRGFDTVHITDNILNSTTSAIWKDAFDGIKTANDKHKPAFVYLHAAHVHDYANNLFKFTEPGSFYLDPTYQFTDYPSQQEFTQLKWDAMMDFINNTINTSWNAEVVAQYKTWLRLAENAQTVDEAKSVYLSLPANMQRPIYHLFAATYVNLYQFDSLVSLARHNYDQSIWAFDNKFTPLLERLRQNGLTDNTVVVILGDYGELLGEHNVVGHALAGFYEKELHVPMIWHVPNAGHRTVSSLAQLIDVYPTLVNLVGIPKPDTLAGINLRGQMFGDPRAPKNTYTIGYLIPHDISYATQIPFTSNQYSIQTDAWRLVEVHNPGGTYQTLYDRKTDPGELHNMIVKAPDVAQTLSSLLHTTLDRQIIYPPILPAISP